MIQYDMFHMTSCNGMNQWMNEWINEWKVSKMGKQKEKTEFLKSFKTDSNKSVWKILV